MFSSLSQWVLGVVGRPSRSPGYDERQDQAHQEAIHSSPPPPPFLPAERAHQLETFQDEDSSCDATANGAFFQRLPPDIRRLVLIETFGDRIVHVDLRLLKPGGSLGEHVILHGCQPDQPLHKTGKVMPLSPSHPSMQWRWYGCVCHREPEWRVRNHTILMNKSLSPPWFDMCLDTKSGDNTVKNRSGLVCGEWSGQEPLKCRIGAMGWLRTCRQAYAEGIEVLYGTNRFHFSGTVLLQSLGRFLRSEHLALIQSAEMVWNGPEIPMARPPDNGQDYSTDKRFAAWYTLTALMSNVPAALPNLRYLSITPGCYWYPPNMAPNDVLKLVQKVFLEPFDAMVQTAVEENSRLQDVHIAAPLDMESMRLLHNAAPVEKGPELQLSGHVVYDDRLWRSIDPKGDDEMAGHEKLGYWLSDYIISRAST